MKKIITSLSLVAVAATLLSVAPAPKQAVEDNKALWKQYDEALKKGLPKTAIKHLEPIIAQALKDKNYDEAIKAIGKKIALEGNIQGNLPEEKINRLEAEIAKAPKEMVPMMDAILANWYWHYFQRNRWRYMQRTAGAGGKDIKEWSLPRILEEIDNKFQKALAARVILKKTPVGDYADLLQKGSTPESYRPTMFDFVAYNALQFYQAPEQAGSKASDAFEISADSPIFADADEFVKWNPKTTDNNSRKLRAIKLYQELIRFHSDDAKKDALIDADLWRLQFGKAQAFGETKNANYKKALGRFITKWADHQISARARHQQASVLQGEGDYVAAHKVAKQGVDTYPNSPGGAMCHNLVQQIEAKESQVTVERIWNNPQPNIQVKYRNVDQIHFRVIADDYERLIRTRNWRPESLNRNEQLALLNKEIVKEWSVKLKPTDDFQEQVVKIDVPKGLPKGFYFLISSHTKDFGANNNRVYFSDFWVSDLAIVMRNRSGEGRVEGFVLDAISGEPVAGAKLRGWWRQGRNRVEAAPTTSDANGKFSFPAANRGYLILASKDRDQLSTARDHYNSNRFHNPRPYSRTVFFTDRSLYRPGQTIEYKGISYSVDQHGDNYQVMKNQFLTVIFRDRNGKEIDKQQQRANEFGSFSGKFTAPRDRLMGRMSLQVQGGPGGSTSFNVEEYKRPKFQVAIDDPKVAAKLHGKVNITGKATAYTGVAINDAKVKWRVVREVRYPSWWGWCYWWRPMPQGKSQEIAHGISGTKPDGSFDIEFTALPDLSVPEKDEPTFHYKIHADVTDTTGETRSADNSINVGYTALKASVSAGEWQTVDNEVALNISTTSLDGIGQSAEGSLKIYALKEPETVQREKLRGGYYPMPRLLGRRALTFKPEPDLSKPNSWELGKVVEEKGFTTDKAGSANFAFNLPVGSYRAMLETQDRFGKKVTAQLPIQVLNPKAGKLSIKVPHVLKAPQWTIEPGGEFMALWGSGYDQARAYVEVVHRRKTLQAFWTERGLTQFQIKQAVNEAMRGGFTLHVTMVRENRAYLTSQKVNVPWTNKNLSVKWEHFTDKLEPGNKETWTAVVTGPNAKKAVAEMVATLYDESLDQFKPHQWQTAFNVFRQDYSHLRQSFENQTKNLQYIQGQWPRQHKGYQLSYHRFPGEITANLWGFQYFGARKNMAFRGGGGRGRPEMALAEGAPAPPMAAMRMAKAAPGQAMEMQADAAVAEDAADDGVAGKRDANGVAGAESNSPDLTQVTARKNLNETAFFLPHLVANKDGEVRMEFTIPEALTQWKFMGFTHGQSLESGYLTDTTVTAKDLMVQPNPPRFLREGDMLEFTVKVSNLSDEVQKGKVMLTFNDATSGDNVDPLLNNEANEKAFEVPAKQSKTYSWRLQVPDGMGFLAYKAVGATDKMSDGEANHLPVLSRRIFVTESLPLPIRGAKTKNFNFDKLIGSGKSDTIQHERYTVQMVSNPSWYAVMALPYLMENPHEGAEQTFNRLYANSLAQHIANSDPRIRQVFDQWRNTPALDSPLEKNQDLKAVMLEETPWLRQAKKESQARRNVGILFEDGRLAREKNRILTKLRELQRPDGAWSWFPGGPANDYMTLYIATGFGRMRHLGVNVDASMAIKALNRMDGWIQKRYRWIVDHGHKDKNNLSTTIAFYLYGRSFFLKDRKIAPQHKEAVDYFLAQAKKHWLHVGGGIGAAVNGNRQSQAHIAIGLNRFGDKVTPRDIIASLKERSVTDEEMGMFWRDTEHSWWWYRAPIETQAMMIEALHEVARDFDNVEECKVWLLKQKQTRDWKTTKATADACYALLLQGANWLANEALVEVTVGDTKIDPKNVEAGTGFYEHRFLSSDVKPEMGKIKVTKHDEGVAWGSVHWQYMEDISKITPHEGTPLTLQKKLFIKVNTNKGPQLKPFNGTAAVGDELVQRIVLRTDRDMEYVHLKDQRGSGTEPVNVLSRYRYQDGLGYYESTRDTATHFFIDYLPKGTYVFEYSVRVQHKGQYQSGMASIQCMYAPEFNSHSESHKLTVQ